MVEAARGAIREPLPAHAVCAALACARSGAAETPLPDAG